MTAIDIAPASGRLGVLTPGMGAVATTFYAGVIASRAGHTLPIGSLTQMGHIRLGKRTEQRNPMIKDFVPLAGLDDLVFGGWDPISDDSYRAAQRAGVLTPEDLAVVRDELSEIRPMTAVFSHDWVKKLEGVDHVKTEGTLMDKAEALIADIERFKADEGCDRLVMVWCGSTEAYRAPTEVHSSVASFEQGLKEDHREIAPSQVYAYAALKAGVPFANGAPNITVEVPAMLELAAATGTPTGSYPAPPGPRPPHPLTHTDGTQLSTT